MPSSSLCILYPTRGELQKVSVPVDYDRRSALFGVHGTESKCIKAWDFADSVYDGYAADWSVWVHMTFPDAAKGPVNVHAPWIRGNAFLSVVVEGHSRREDDDEVVVLDTIDFDRLAPMEDLDRLVRLYGQFREAHRRAMALQRPGRYVDVSSTPDATEARSLKAQLGACDWIDAFGRLGFSQKLAEA